MSVGGGLSPEQLWVRRIQLRERKVSFIELVMQVKKKIYREQMAARKKAARNGDLRNVRPEKGDAYRQGAD